jgi:hypothetical protein
MRIRRVAVSFVFLFAGYAAAENATALNTLQTTAVFAPFLETSKLQVPITTSSPDTKQFFDRA